MAQYTYVLQDLLSGTIKEEVPLRAVKYGKVLNAPGFFNASIDYRHPKATAENFARNRTAVYILRDGVCVWGGILWTVRKNGDGLNIGCEGFWSYFRKRRIRYTLTFPANDPIYIARYIMNVSQDPNLSPGGNIGVIIGSELANRGNVKRQWLSYERQIVSEVIEALSDNAISFDFEIDCTYDPVTNTFAKRMKFYSPKQGKRTRITWEVGAHCDLNEYYLDGKKQENHVYGIGAGDGAAMLIRGATDTAQLNKYPMLEGVYIAKDISDGAHLAELSADRLARRRMPGATPGITLHLDAPDAGIGDFVVGDEVRLVGGDGFCQFDQFFRIDSWTVDVSEEGDERMQVQFVDRSLVQDEVA